jgi:hypothetical protein
MQKVKDIADYLNKYPNATVEITGYADKGTGNATINKNLSAKRAQAVVDALTKNYGVSASRIKSDSKGDTEQPFEEAILNRDRFERVFTMPVYEDANQMKFDAMWFPHPDIEELWDSERFIIEILPSTIDLKTVAAVYGA